MAKRKSDSSSADSQRRDYNDRLAGIEALESRLLLSSTPAMKTPVAFSDKPLIAASRGVDHATSTTSISTRRPATTKPNSTKPPGKTTVVSSDSVTPTVTWINASGGDWSNPANWSLDRLPNSGDDVSISIPSNVTITFSQGSATIHSLRSANAFTFSGGTLSALTTIEVDNNFTMSGGDLANAIVLRGSSGQGLTLLSGTLNAVTLDADLIVAANSSATIVNGLTLNGTATLGDSSNDFGQLLFSGSQTLSGTGTVQFLGVTGNSFQSGLLGTSMETLTIGPNITVEGQRGYVGIDGNVPTLPTNVTVINEGTIESSGSTGAVTMQGLACQNTGTLEATAGGALYLGGTWNGLGGTVVANSRSSVCLLGGTTAINNAGLSTTISGGGTFVSIGTIYGGTLTLTDETIFNPGGSTQVGLADSTLIGMTINGNVQLTGNTAATIESGLTLNGTVTLGDSNNEYGQLFFSGGSQTFSGTGTVQFVGVTGNSYQSGLLGTSIETLTIGPNVTIEGQRGYVGLDGNVSTLPTNNVTVINEGTIESNGSTGAVTVQGLSCQNTGTLEASAGGALYLGGTWNGLGGTVVANSGSSACLLGGTTTINNAGLSTTISGGGTFVSIGTIYGGTLTLTDETIFNPGGSTKVGLADSTLICMTINGNVQLTGNTAATIESGLTLNGTVTLGDSNNDYGQLFFSGGSQTFSGTGTVQFVGVTGNSYQSGLLGTSIETLTIGPNVTIEGQRGYVGLDGNVSTLPTNNVTVINDGTIESNGSIGAVTVQGLSCQNTGTLEATAGGTLYLGGTWNGLGGNVIANPGSDIALLGNGTKIENTGLSTTITGGGAFTSIGAIDGGTLTLVGTTVFDPGGNTLLGFSGSTLAGMTINGNIQLTENTFATIQSGLTLNGTATLGGPTGSGNLIFNGSQTLGGNGDILFGSNSNNAVTLQAAGATLTIGANFTIHGASGSIGIGAAAIINDGTINDDVAGGTITLGSNTVACQNNGTFEASSGGTFTVAAILSNLSNGTLIGGTYTIGAASTLNLGAAVTTNDATVVADGSGATFTAANSIIVNIGSLTVVNGSLSLTNALTNLGTLNVGAGGTLSIPALTMIGGSTTFAASGDLQVGTLTIADATLDVPGSLSMGYSSSSPNHGALSVVGSETSPPTITLISAATSPGTLVLAEGEIVVAPGTAAAINATPVGPGQLCGAIDLSGEGNFDVDGAPYVPGHGQPDLSISALLTDGGLIKTGAGALALSNTANAFTGGVSAIGGTVVLENPSSFTGGITTLSSGPSFGTVAAGSDADLGAASNSIELQGGTLEASSTFSTSRSVVVGDPSGNGDGMIAVTAGNTLTVTTPITGKAGLIAVGSGTLELNAAAQYSGRTRVTGGTLLLGPGADISSSYQTTVGAGAILDLGNQSRTLQALAGSGNISLGSGTLTIADPGSANATIFSGTITGSGGVNRTGPGSLTLSGSSSFTGGLAATGGATIFLTAASTFKGGIVDAASSTIIAASDASLGDFSNSITLAGGTFQATGPITTGRNITLSPAGGTINVPAASTLAVAGILSGTGNLVFAGGGTLRLTDADTFNGSVALRGGTLALSGGGTLDSVSSFNVSAASTLLLDDSAGNASSSRLAATSLINSGGGQVQLRGAAGSSSSESLGTLTILPGQSSVSVTDGAGNGSTASLMLAGLVHRIGSQIVFQSGDGSALGGADQVLLGTYPAGVLPAWARIKAAGNLVACVCDPSHGVEPAAG